MVCGRVRYIEGGIAARSAGKKRKHNAGASQLFDFLAGRYYNTQRECSGCGTQGGRKELGGFVVVG